MSMASKADETIPSPPAAFRRPYAISQHGQIRNGGYFWLSDRHEPETHLILCHSGRRTSAVPFVPP